MMSVPAINSVLPPSGNQPAKINSSPTASSSVSSLGIPVPPKISVIPPPQIPTSPNKPPLGVNHSQVPLSLVYENKVIGSQGQSSITKPTTDKPKDLSPSKSTPNGVETTSIKTSPNTQPTQPSQPSQPSTPLISKAEDISVQQTTVNHSEERSSTKSESTPSGDEPVPSTVSQPQNATSGKVDSSKCENISKEEGSSVEEAKEDKETKESNEIAKSDNNSEKTEEKTATAGQTNKRKREQKPEEKKDDPEPEQGPEKKTRRIRSQVLPYQSPLPELATFINKSLKEKDASQKSNEEKLIVFYKNEFLAVRNAEGGFYLCQTLQNVYRTSHRIRIRWLSQKEGSDSEGDIYAPDFYDFTANGLCPKNFCEDKNCRRILKNSFNHSRYPTPFQSNPDFECILTTVALSKMEKNMYKLRKVELERIENILKRALDVEKGVTEKPSITEEHPDGIDLSLYKDESQLQKPKNAPKRKASSPDRKSPKQTRKSGSGEATIKLQPAKATSKKTNKVGKKIAKPASKKVKGKKGKSESSKSKAVDQLKVSPPNEKARVVAKVLRKVDIVPVKEVSTKKAKSKTAKRSPTVSKSQKKKAQRSGKKPPQEAGKEEPTSSHHERRQGKNKYSNNKNKKN